jgi:hypothetical protein
MITEDRLRGLLDEAALTFDPPTDGPAQIVAAAADAQPEGPRRTMVTPRRLALAGALAASLFAVSYIAGGADHDAPSEVQTAQQESRDVDSPGAVVADRATSNLATTGGGVVTNNSASTADVSKIVKTGAIEVEVADGRVGAAMARVSTIASGAGGFVTESESNEGDRQARARIIVRVPADRFEAVLTEMRRIGTVQLATTSGLDVTGEYTDVEARLRTLNATRESLQQVLSQARSVGDILAVRDRITEVQTQIEQLQGRKQVLDNQVALSTLQVTVYEPGGSVIESSNRSAWERAVDGFTSTWSALLANAGAVVAVLIAMAVLATALSAGAIWVRRAYLRSRA